MANQLSRRNLLKLIGTGAVSAGVLTVTQGHIFAQEELPRQTINAIYTFNIGDWDMAVIKDVSFALEASVFGVNQDTNDVLSFFSDIGILQANNMLNALADILIARNGDEIIVFDTGMGTLNGGLLVESLVAINIAPTDVTKVIMSHWHPDHINGLSHDGTLTFPNALVMFPESEYGFMQSLPDITGEALQKLQPAIDNEQIQFYNDGNSIAGINAIAAPGHTPGHMNFIIESNGQQLVNMVDTVLNVYSHTRHPNWHAQFDAIGDVATQTRISLMNMVADEQLLIFGYHFPFPGLGHIVRDGDMFRFYPVAF